MSSMIWDWSELDDLVWTGKLWDRRQKGHRKCMSWGRWGQSTHMVKSRCLRLQWNKSLGQEAKQIKSDARVIYFSACFSSEKCSSLFLIPYIQRECKNQSSKKFYFDFDWNYIKWIDCGKSSFLWQWVFHLVHTTIFPYILVLLITSLKYFITFTTKDLQNSVCHSCQSVMFCCHHQQVDGWISYFTSIICYATGQFK